MALKEMYDYLPGTATADYTATTMSLSPQDVIPEEGGFPGQKVLKTHGNKRLTTTPNIIPEFTVSLVFKSISALDMGTLIDFYYDTAKAKGMDRSFKWAHPTDGHTYVVQFMTKTLRRDLHFLTRQGGTIKLYIVDRVND